jgi:hypothetical protein
MGDLALAAAEGGPAGARRGDKTDLAGRRGRGCRSSTHSGRSFAGESGNNYGYRSLCLTVPEPVKQGSLDKDVGEETSNDS